jgi:hypothetical protein
MLKHPSPSTRPANHSIDKFSLLQTDEKEEIAPLRFELRSQAPEARILDQAILRGYCRSVAFFGVLVILVLHPIQLIVGELIRYRNDFH